MSDIRYFVQFDNDEMIGNYKFKTLEKIPVSENLLKINELDFSIDTFKLLW